MALLREARTDLGDPETAIAAMAEALGRAAEGADDPVLAERIRRVMAGETPRQILGITAEEAEALYAHGYGLLQRGDVDGAAVVLDKLIQLDPLEARYFYCRGVCHHQKGDLVAAVRFYSHFLALDATNPDGWLRMAECHLAAGEATVAREMGETARDFADRQGNAAVAAHARALLARMAGEGGA